MSAKTRRMTQADHGGAQRRTVRGRDGREARRTARCAAGGERVAQRSEPAVPLSSGIAAVLDTLPAAALGGILDHADFLASNVPGSPIPLYIADAEVVRYYPFPPTIGSAVNFTLMSHAEHCCIGIDVDAAAVPDFSVPVDCVAEGFRQVTDMCGGSDTDTSIEVTLPNSDKCNLP